MSEIGLFSGLWSRARQLRAACVLALALAGCSDSGDGFELIHSEPPRPVQGEPPFVLVHGGWFTGGSWATVQGILQAGGSNVVTLDLPGRAGDMVPPTQADLALAVDKLCVVLEAQREPAILVGHGLSGAVITQAIARCGAGVRALVYVAAVVPRSGESALTILQGQRDPLLERCIQVDERHALLRIEREGPVEETFFTDLREVAAGVVEQAVATLVDEPLGIVSGVLAYDEGAFAAVPKFYVHTLGDRVLTINTQRALVSRTAMSGVDELATGHAPFLAQPRQLAEILVGIRGALVAAPD
jgi:pimeloyl-ACP methyl ester carboxylesterase